MRETDLKPQRLMRFQNAYKLELYSNFSKLTKKTLVDICDPEAPRTIDINSWIPLLFMVLDGVGDHRALYHVPNYI